MNSDKLDLDRGQDSSHWDLLSIDYPTAYLIIRSTDPAELQHFADYLVARLGAKQGRHDRLKISRHELSFWVGTLRTDNIEDFEKPGKVYATDLYYELQIEARSRGWMPHRRSGSFVRFYSPD